MRSESHVRRISRKTFKYTLLAAAGAAVIASGAAAYFIATFDVKSYEPRIKDIVREKTGRTLTIAGDVKLSFWPDLSIETGPLSLAERDGSTVFATVQSARLGIELRPLLARQVIVKGLEVRGAHVEIVRDQAGRLNIDDLLGREGPPSHFDIGRVKVSDATLAFRDLASGDVYAFSGISVLTGRLTNAVPTSLELAFGATKQGAAWQTNVTMKSALTLDPDREVTTLERVVLSGTGTFGQDHIDFSVAAARAASAPMKLTVDDFDAALTAAGTAGATRIKLRAPRLYREKEVVTADALTSIVELDRGATTVNVTLSTAANVDFTAKRLALEALKADITVRGPQVPRKALAATLSGSAAVDLGKQGVQLKLSGTTEGSRVTADISAAGFAAPVYTFKVSADKLDLDRYTSPAQPPRGTTPRKSDALLDPFADLPATGTLRVGTLKAGEMTAKDVTIVLR